MNTADEEQEIDLAKVTEEIKEIKSEIEQTENALKKTFDELGLEYPF